MYFEIAWVSILKLHDFSFCQLGSFSSMGTISFIFLTVPFDTSAAADYSGYGKKSW